MPTMITYNCQQCGGSYQRLKGNPSGKYCSRHCTALANKPSQHLLIPDGAPMSVRTMYRRKQAAGLTHPKPRQPFNEAFFDTWSDEMAWLLGLIWSDGCLYGTTVEISSRDLQLLDLVMSLIEGGTYNLKNRGNHIRVHFSSKYTAERLRSLGLTEKKSLTIGWPDIKPEYEGAFLRGLIDGDGSVLSYQNRHNQQVPDLRVQLVTASSKLKDGIQYMLDRNKIRYSVHVRIPTAKGNPLWKFHICEQASLRRLHELLYPWEGVCCLHRKRIPYDIWITTPRPRSTKRETTDHSQEPPLFAGENESHEHA